MLKNERTTNVMGNSLEAASIIEIERLTKEACIGREIKFAETPALPGIVFIHQPDGEIEEREKPRGLYKTKLDTPAAFVAYVKEVAEKNTDGTIFYTETGLVYVFGDDFAKDRAVCPLTLSPQFKQLAAIAGKPMSQAQFVRLLRVDFNGCVGSEGLLPLVRNLKWSAGSESSGNIQHGRESMGRSITAEVRGEAAIPEETYLVIQPWENFPFATRVDCAIEIDAANKTFALTPYPLSMRKAIDAGVEQIAELLTAKDMPPAFLGQP